MYAQPGYLIRRAHQTASAAFTAATSDMDLTPVQFSAMVAIKTNPDIDATRVSEMIAFDRTTIGLVLGRLERKKLITRRNGIKDKRTKHLRLTSKGEATVRAVSARVDSIRETILKPFTATERAQLLKLLQKFDTALAATPDADGAAPARHRKTVDPAQ
jgi:DNA-binding MarR family transcriptional regulator